MALSAWIPFPMIMIAGTILFISLISTATLGFMIMKGKGDIPLPWHINLARLTIVIALIHGFLAMAWYLGW
ncbi:MAG: hypothetical protein E4H16_03515 [Candidatus Atribacteria bacterium]|nr:MAG: hypothetical protein E4H16_03515 [Candidatus Atribacteria bacterium]